jgi:hypothetical protein
VQRSAEEERFDDRPPLERRRQLGALEALEPSEQSQIRRRRVLCLQPGELLHGLRHTERLPLDEKLTRQERPVEITSCQDPLAHAPILPTAVRRETKLARTVNEPLPTERR